jgi:hypothetical protein
MATSGPTSSEAQREPDRPGAERGTPTAPDRPERPTDDERRAATPEGRAEAARQAAARAEQAEAERDRLACPVCGALALETVTKGAATHLAHGRKKNDEDPNNVFYEFADTDEAPAGTWFCNSCNAAIVETEAPAPAR